jgi:hypothetical protein
MTVVSAVIRRLAEGLPGGFLFQRLSVICPELSGQRIYG